MVHLLCCFKINKKVISVLFMQKNAILPFFKLISRNPFSICYNFRLFFLPAPPPPPPPPPRPSHELQYISVTSGFTRLSIKTKYVCRGLISSYVNFHYNRTSWSTKFYLKICRWGKRKKSPILLSLLTVLFPHFSPHL